MGIRILVAEDEPMTRKLIVGLLRRAGHEVTDFEDGEALWEEYQREPAPIIVTDWMMPKLEGIEVCRRIRAEHPDVYTHVMIVTSLASNEHTLEAYEAGVDDFVAKPIHDEILSRQIASAVRSYLAHQEQGLRRSLELAQDALGADHTALLAPLSRLAEAARRRDALGRCRAFIRRQVEIATKAYGPTHEETLRLQKELDAVNAVKEPAAE